MSLRNLANFSHFCQQLKVWNRIFISLLLTTYFHEKQIPNFSRVDIVDDLIRISSNLCKDDRNLSWSYVSSFSGFVCICRGKWHFVKGLFFASFIMWTKWLEFWLEYWLEFLKTWILLQYILLNRKLSWITVLKK